MCYQRFSGFATRRFIGTNKGLRRYTNIIFPLTINNEIRSNQIATISSINDPEYVQ